MDYRDDDDFDYQYRESRENRENRAGRRRRYRDDDYLEELSECVKNGICASKDYEKLAEMTDNREDKMRLMKMAQREKEHYRTTREMLDRYM